MPIDRAAADALLTTTRSVRKRLDFTRPVPAELILECIDIALQAPTGTNAQGWQWMVVTDPAKKKAIADLYRKGGEIMSGQGYPPPLPEGDPRIPSTARVMDSATYLAGCLEDAPAFVIPCIEGRVENMPMVVAQASTYGSILPAAWSFMLAARARGLGTAWTSIHLFFEKDVSELLGIPANYTQVALFPVAYYTGDDFKPADRLPAGPLTHWDTWGTHQG